MSLIVLLASNIVALGENTNSAKEEAPAIVRIKTKSNFITVKSTTSGPLYSITDNAGKELVNDVTLEQLKTKDVALYEVVKNAVASDSKIDASIFR